MVLNSRPLSACGAIADLIVVQSEAHIQSSTNELSKNTKYLVFALLA
jgi:hypothetical protein